ncbi:MAG: hypothetical protein FJ115_04140 [Deltaproteobacteria bacterium]|nr:hypothetical protein [Deltaproteobacteria bacterium]MBM4322730.1 hypothetical protein [Deltaproteobacteria bacterium]
MNNSPKKEGYPLIPAQSVKCIWMTAGFISYKLCKYDLQCEKCPLDWELRNLSPTPSCDSDAPPLEGHLRTGEIAPLPLSEKETQEEEAREELQRCSFKNVPR